MTTREQSQHRVNERLIAGATVLGFDRLEEARRGEESMRRIMLTALAAMALMFSFTTSANADTFTQTINQHNVTVSSFIPIGCGGPTLTYTATGNLVQHITVNGAGDFWVTATFEGTGTLTTGGHTYPGHLIDWFGQEENNKNGVIHATFNFVGDGLTVHGAFDTTTNANGTVTADHFNVSCR